MSPMRGPLPSYRPEFPSTFLKQAEKIVRHRTVKYQLRQRATLVLLLDQQPLLSNVGAAERGRRQSARARRRVGATGGRGETFPRRKSQGGAARRRFPRWLTRWSRRSPVNWSRKPSN